MRTGWTVKKFDWFCGLIDLMPSETCATLDMHLAYNRNTTFLVIQIAMELSGQANIISTHGNAYQNTVVFYQQPGWS